MLRWLKKYFIPHHKNNHHPHFFRTEGRLFVFVSIFLLQALFVGAILIFSRTDLFADIFPDVLVSEANSVRQTENLSPLVSNPILAQAAKLKAEDMATKGYFAHVSPDGTTPWYWFDKAGYKFSYAGENLAINFFDSKDLADAWMASPLHKANIMSDKFTEIGIATARGIYDGRETVFVVQFFGRPTTSTRLPKPPAQVSGSTPQEKFISVGEGEVRSEDIKLVAPTETPNEPEEFIQKIISSPRQTVNTIQFALLALVLAALGFAVFIEIKVQKAAPILSGILMLFIIGGVVYVNHLISTIAQVM